MSVYMTEEEQVEQIKKWWKQYGSNVLTAILIVALAFSGWRWWQQRQLKIATHASVVYQGLLNSASAQDNTGVLASANTLLTQYAGTPYAALASLSLAKAAVEKKQYPVALKHLQWVIDKAAASSLKQIARIRSARILLAQKKPQQALAVLKTINDSSYQPVIDEVRGDSYLAQGNEQQAKQAYQLAWQAAQKAKASRPLLKMKLNNLSVVKHHAAA